MEPKWEDGKPIEFGDFFTDNEDENISNLHRVIAVKVVEDEGIYVNGLRLACLTRIDLDCKEKIFVGWCRTQSCYNQRNSSCEGCEIDMVIKQLEEAYSHPDVDVCKDCYFWKGPSATLPEDEDKIGICHNARWTPQYAGAELRRDNEYCSGFQPRNQVGGLCSNQ